MKKNKKQQFLVLNLIKSNGEWVGINRIKFYGEDKKEILTAKVISRNESKDVDKEGAKTVNNK